MYIYAHLSFNYIVILVTSYLWNDKSYNKYVAMHRIVRLLNEFNINKKPSYSKNVIILGFCLLWLFLTSFIAEATKVGSKLD